MLKWTRYQKKTICLFALFWFLAMLCTGFPLGSKLHLYDIQSFLYMGIILGWGFLVHQRILNVAVRKYLDIATAFMILLFVSRMLRYAYFKDNPVVIEYAWYAYYVSFTMVPLCVLYAALYVGKQNGETLHFPGKWLWGLEAAFCVLILTNAWHNQLLRFTDQAAGKCTYGPFYYCCLLWGASLTMLSFLIILKRCSINEVRKNWFVPSLGMLLGVTMMVAYFFCKGSPEIFGISIYNLQEAFCITYILPFECMIQLGILPNNSRYELFFQKSPLHAVIYDKAGKIAYESGDFHIVNGKTDLNKEGNFRRSEKEIPGGRIVWYEDMTAVLRIGEEIAKVTEQLEEENDLIRQENEIRTERISYETKNRLYDKIADALKEKAVLINEMISSKEFMEWMSSGDERWKEQLVHATVLGVYVKRMGNLMLITEENNTISTRELAISIKESLEYFALSGRTQELREKREEILPAKQILLAFEIYEKVMELAYDSIFSMAVRINHDDESLLSMEFDAGEEFGEQLEAVRKNEELRAVGGAIFIKNEDDTWQVNLQFQGCFPACKREGKEET